MGWGGVGGCPLSLFPVFLQILLQNGCSKGPTDLCCLLHRHDPVQTLCASYVCGAMFARPRGMSSSVWNFIQAKVVVRLRLWRKVGNESKTVRIGLSLESDSR